MQYVPFQGLLIGDPMCRPFAQFPTIVGNAPGGTLGGVVQFTPTVTAAAGFTISSVELYIDGVLHSTRLPGQPFTVNTSALPGGDHEWRLLAYDTSVMKTVGRWVGSFSSSEAVGHAVTAGISPGSGDLNTLFQVNASANGAIKEMRLLHNGRVVAASNTSPATLQVYGQNLGAGNGHVQVEAIFSDNRTSLSQVMPVSISYAGGAASGLAPAAFSYTKRVIPGTTCAVELPARYDDLHSGVAWSVLTPPSVATIGSGGNGYRVVTAPANACGQDQFTFRVQTPGGTSNTATVTLLYANLFACPPDINNDGNVNTADFTAYLQAYAAGNLRADFNGDCALNTADFTAYLQVYVGGCP
jgi:hypothetical protein